MKRTFLLLLALLASGCGQGGQGGQGGTAGDSAAVHSDSSKAKPRGCFE